MKRKRIGICAPSTPLLQEDSELITALARQKYPDAELVFSEQCYAKDGHFAGNDTLRGNTFVQMANDPDLDAIWFARGGYGAARIAEAAVARLKSSADDKIYMGYSDAGNLLGALYKAGIGKPVHGPMPVDIRRADGDTAIHRALSWLIEEDTAALEPQIDTDHRYAAFNLITLAMMTGTSLMPDLSGHILLIEEVSEYHYAVDRAMFNIANHLKDRGIAGLRLGQVTSIPENDRPFGQDEIEICRNWCDRYGISYLGRAQIGHDATNHIVPFGRIKAQIP